MTDLYDAMRYSVLSGGKRIRPVLTLEFARLARVSTGMLAHARMPARWSWCTPIP